LNEEQEKMSQENVKPTEETLDPQDWEAMRALGHRMVDDMMTYLQNVRSKPGDPLTRKAIDEICVPLTQEGEGEEKVYRVFQGSILPYTLSATSPRFLGFVAGTGSPYGMFVEMLRAGVNSLQEGLSVEGQVHRQVINWLKEMLDFPHEAGGVLVNGGSEANFTGLAVARNAMAKVDIK
jgi:aromatic-L-amino-acid/L-tryptophan decarboxylase